MWWVLFDWCETLTYYIKKVNCLGCFSPSLLFPAKYQKIVDKLYIFWKRKDLLGEIHNEEVGQHSVLHSKHDEVKVFVYGM